MIHLEDGFYGLVVMDIAIPLVSICEDQSGWGGGYKFDISRGNADFNDTDIDNSKFQASIVRIGFNERF
jgi:hypothetical protein